MVTSCHLDHRETGYSYRSRYVHNRVSGYALDRADEFNVPLPHYKTLYDVAASAMLKHSPADCPLLNSAPLIICERCGAVHEPNKEKN